MAIIVDKIQKRKDIALSCKALFIEYGIKNLTISKVAQTAGVGKGTIYEYFKNKDDIVFEIVNILLLEHNEKKRFHIDKLKTSKEKIKAFFNIFHTDEESELREMYKEFVSISLQTPSQEMMAFQEQCNITYFNWFEAILQEGINNGELHPNAKKLARGLFAVGEGLFIAIATTNMKNNFKEELDNFYDVLFEFIEVKR